MVFFHGGLHIVNLAIGDAAKKLPKSWIKHMQKTISWFRRSAERTASLRAAGIAVEAEIEEMQTALNEIVDAKGMGFTNLSMYCKTRWSGMFSSAMSLIRCWPALLTLKSDLIAKGWGPSDGDDAEIAGFGVARPGALPRGAGANPDDDPIGSALSAADPNAALNCGDTTASAKKRSVLLSSTLGITDAMWGMSIAVAEVLRPMNILIKRMQTVKQPVQHRFSRWIKEALMLVEVHFAGTPGGGAPAFTAPYRGWQRKMREAAILKVQLVDEVDAIAMAFAKAIVKSARARFAPYIAFYEAAALIDPLHAAVPDDTVWAAVQLLCERNGLDYDEVHDSIVGFRATVPLYLSPQQTRGCRENLLKMYFDKNFIAHEGVEKFAVVVFVMPLTQALVESLFSIMGYNKSAQRASLSDESTAAVVHLHDAVDVLADTGKGDDGSARVVGPFSEAPRLDLASARDHILE